MLIDTRYVNCIIDELGYLFNAFEHNEIPSDQVQEAIKLMLQVRNTLFCTCTLKHPNNVKVCPLCKKQIFIRWDNL